VTRLRRRSTGLTTVLLLAGLVVGAASGLGPSKVIGHGVRLKGTKLWYAQGKALSPRTISARVVPVPEQPVKVQWSVVCQKPNKIDPAVDLAANERSGQVSVRAAATVKLALPYPRPPDCIVTVYATLGMEGTVMLRLQQT
jgi:hypothetical protein